MAWLARSIANSLKLDEEDEDNEKLESSDVSVPNQSVTEAQSPRGVKEDISELTKTLRSQFWGVASFLSQPPNQQSPDQAEEDEDLIAGIRNDFAEIGGRFRTGISKLSENLPVSDFTKIASNFLQLSSEGVDPKDYDGVIGVTEELVAFVRDLATHPETWLDLPLPDEDDDDDIFNDFEMNDDQHEHALAVERLVPSLASLRIEICPEYMTENCFWMIYFVLLHPKLSQHDALLLSTPQVLEARAILSHELQKINRSPVEAESSEANAVVVEPLDVPCNPTQESLVAKTVNPQEFETDKHPIESKEIQVVDKSVIEERNSSDSSSSSRFINVQAEEVEEEEDADDWLNDEETSEPVSSIEGGGVTTKHPLGEDDEDVSFSDLEDDDEEGDVPVSSKKSTNSSSPDWVQL